MKSLKWMLTSLFIFIFGSNILSQQYQDHPFYPSAVGNTWEYNSEHGFQRIEILKDSLDTDGNRYLFTYDLNRADKMIDTFYNVYRRNSSIDSVWYLYYKMNADTGDTWMIIPRDYNSLVGRLDFKTEDYLFGEIRQVLVFGIYDIYTITNPDSLIPDGTWPIRDEYFAENVGKYYTWNHENGPVLSLLGCVINGDTLGNIVVDYNTLEQDIVEDFKLYQNYPNPFNPITNIPFTISNGGEVILEIYDVLGQKKETLLNKFLRKGSYKIQFDGADFTSGIYFYSLRAGTFQDIKKMLLIK